MLRQRLSSEQLPVRMTLTVEFSFKEWHTETLAGLRKQRSSKEGVFRERERESEIPTRGAQRNKPPPLEGHLLCGELTEYLVDQCTGGKP